MDGVVIRSTGIWSTVRDKQGNIYRCRIRGKLRIQGIKSTSVVTVGDNVKFELEPKINTGVIDKIYKRRNYIVRKSVNLSKSVQILASNIDQVFLIVTIYKPPISLSFIDRFLTSAQAYKIPVVILFNKVDTLEGKYILERDKIKEIYTSIGYTCIDISAKQGYQVDKVKELMVDKVSMFSGHSGVGKSTLANSIDYKLNLKTNKISQIHKQGQHTTTFAQMFSLNFGGYLIDTPGIKGFGIVDFKPQEIGDYFREFIDLKKQCKFKNCLHYKEPLCAIKKAVSNCIIAPSRYHSYIEIINQEDSKYRRDKYSQ